MGPALVCMTPELVFCQKTVEPLNSLFVRSSVAGACMITRVLCPTMNVYVVLTDITSAQQHIVTHVAGSVLLAWCGGGAAG